MHRITKFGGKDTMHRAPTKIAESAIELLEDPGYHYVYAHSISPNEKHPKDILDAVQNRVGI